MKTVLTILLLSLLTLCFNLNAQFKEQTFEIQQQNDLNSKAQELGITTEQLSGMLNSVDHDGSITEWGIEPDAMTVSGFTGENADDFFGASVSSAGDLNGDGYDDVIIGAFRNDAGGNPNSGKAYIFFGGLSMDYTPDITILGENQDDYFGTCVSSAGDVNADGYDDVMVSAPQFDYGGYTSVGKAYIFFGGESMDSTPDVEIYGEEASEQLGVSLSSAGDINGDGINDIIIGAPAYNSFYGRACLYFGSTTISGTPAPDHTWTGENSYDFFGISVSSAGDVNGDGFSDVIIGADENDNVATNAGAAYIFFGNTTLGSTYDLKLTGEAQSNYFGCSVSGAGDVNGDGYSDVIVGARYFNNANPFRRGRAYIYYGGSSMDVSADLIMDGESDSDEFGYSVANVGDLNGDGFSDVIVGAPYWNVSPIQNQGRVYIYFGGTDADNIPDIVLDRASFGPASFGLSVASAGDVNADGYSDILIGAPLATNEGGVTPTGRAFIYKFSATGLNIANLRIDDGYPSLLGYDVSEAGDLNGDGFDDFVVGAPYYLSNQGCAYVFFGGNIINSTPDLILTVYFPNGYFGSSVAGAGDINGDGYDDLLVGASSSDYAAINGGSVYIYLGGAAMDDYPDREIHGTINNLYLGHDVSGAGDLNADGFDDFMISAIGYDSFRGAVYIHKGSPGITISDDLILYGEATFDEFGSSVSNAADLNGDGYDDIIVGAEYNNGNGSSYIYYGGIEMDDIADLLMNGEADEDGFGNSVGTAGDINNDGFSDVIVGAPFNDDGGTDAGKAYVYYGSLAMDNNPDITFVGEREADQFGCSVDKAGDVNNDGFSDVLIGANHNNDVGFQAGKSYIFYGSNSMDNIVDVVMKAEGSEDNFGTSVSTVGDYNNDGLDDVIIGAPLWSGQYGAAYLFLSTFPPVKPNLIYVKDVPYDQGGYVQLRWARSGYDVLGISKITQYLIQRSFPPGETGFAWETIGSLPATHETFYSYVASTPNDSMTNNSGTFYFRITAQTASPEEYWRSNIMYGHSVDNLAPLPPESFYAVMQGDDVKLGWQQNTEPDFNNYLLYRTDDPLANPDTLELFAVILDTMFLDTNPLTGNSYYFLRAQDIHNNLSASVQDSIPEQTTFSMSVSINDGWNMVSVPGLHPINQNINTWWAYRDMSANVFKYNQGYQVVTVTAPGEGYFMKHIGARTYNTGEEWPTINIVSHDPITGFAGWNLFGGFEMSVIAANVTTVPPGLISGPIYGYSGGYFIPENLEPGRGYWIKLTGAGQIIIPELMTKKTQEEEQFFKEDWGKIILTDATGRSFTLYATKGEVNLNIYELPPIPPSGIFDIRFSSGRIAENINTSEKSIDFRGIKYPLTVQVQNIDVQCRSEYGNELNVKIREGEKITISDNLITKLFISSEIVPDKFSLEQNYPNPFNPSTTIRFSLPKATQLKINLYNMLGEKIETIVEGMYEAGFYKVLYNAQNLPSGAYIYRIESSEFVQVKKLILLK